MHQVFEDNGTAYMAIDYIDGRDLLEIIEDGNVKLTPEEVIHITEPVPPLPAPLAPLQALIERMLAKTPEQRFQTGEELAAAVHALELDIANGRWPQLVMPDERYRSLIRAASAPTQAVPVAMAPTTPAPQLDALSATGELELGVSARGREPTLGEVDPAAALPTRPGRRPETKAGRTGPGRVWLLVGLLLVSLGIAAWLGQDRLRAMLPRSAVATELDQADAALTAGRLVEGEDSARSRYEAVLRLDPDNSQARAGLQNVGRALLDQAEAALGHEQLARAQELASSARAVLGGGQALEALERRLRELESRGERLAELLERAQAASAAARWEGPEGAIALYQRAQTADPDNAVAAKGLRDVLAAISSAALVMPERRAIGHEVRAAQPHAAVAAQQRVQDQDAAGERADARAQRDAGEAEPRQAELAEREAVLREQHHSGGDDVREHRRRRIARAREHGGAELNRDRADQHREGDVREDRDACGDVRVRRHQARQRIHEEQARERGDQPEREARQQRLARHVLRLLALPSADHARDEHLRRRLQAHQEQHRELTEGLRRAVRRGERLRAELARDPHLADLHRARARERGEDRGQREHDHAGEQAAAGVVAVARSREPRLRLRSRVFGHAATVARSGGPARMAAPIPARAAVACGDSGGPACAAR